MWLTQNYTDFNHSNPLVYLGNLTQVIKPEISVAKPMPCDPNPACNETTIWFNQTWENWMENECESIDFLQQLPLYIARQQYVGST